MKTYKAKVYYQTGSGYHDIRKFHISAPELPVAVQRVFKHMSAPHLIYKIVVEASEGEIIT
jgi:hypothetical protein